MHRKLIYKCNKAILWGRWLHLFTYTPVFIYKPCIY